MQRQRIAQPFRLIRLERQGLPVVGPQAPGGAPRFGSARAAPAASPHWSAVARSPWATRAATADRTYCRPTGPPAGPWEGPGEGRWTAVWRRGPRARDRPDASVRFTANSQRFQVVVARTDPRRVTQFNRPAVDRRPHRDHVPCRAGGIKHDRPIIAHQGIDQAALTDVRRAGNHHAPRRGQVQPEVRGLQ